MIGILLLSTKFLRIVDLKAWAALPAAQSDDGWWDVIYSIFMKNVL